MAATSGLGRGGRVVKKIMIAVNVFILICAIILIAVGGVATAHEFNGLTSTTLGVGILVIGLLLFFLAFLGAAGAWLENRALLITFFVTVFILSVAEVAIGGVAYALRADLYVLADQAWSGLYQVDREAISNIEDAFHCCGWNNVSDRSVPPFGNETSCSSLHPGYGSCNDGIYNALYFAANNKQNEYGRQVLRDFQTQWGCCGWTSANDDLFLPFFTENFTQCKDYLGNQPPCQPLLDTYWHNSKAVGFDAVIVQMGTQYRCCGWNTVTDAASPPYSNNTCTNIKYYTSPCRQSVNTVMEQSLNILGGGAIAMAVIQLVSLVLTLTMIILTRNKRSPAGGASSASAGAVPMQTLDDGNE